MKCVEVSQPLGRVWDMRHLISGRMCSSCCCCVTGSRWWLTVIVSPLSHDNRHRVTGNGQMVSKQGRDTALSRSGITSHYRHMPETHLSPLEITSLLSVVTGDGGGGGWALALHTALKAPIRHRELKLDHRDHTGYWVWFEKMSNGLKWYLSDDAVWATLTGDVSNFTPT